VWLLLLYITINYKFDFLLINLSRLKISSQTNSNDETNLLNRQLEIEVIFVCDG
jgi:hypothetical protein